MSLPAKPAQTAYPIQAAIGERWSPRAFDPAHMVELEKIGSLLEAARWAASSYNEQPWRFVVATRAQTALYEKVLGCLVEANQAWARHAPVLMLSFIRTRFEKDGKPNRVALHDLGLAMGNLSLQAQAMGLHVHQMAGIDVAKIRESFAVPELFEPATALAIGYQGAVESLTQDWMRQAEAAPRTRKPLDELLIGDTWDQPGQLPLYYKPSTS